ncbi:MAG: STAS domain-containing protein [Ruminococcus sp.]|nr:STAS domain-containing protein [Ruminococcus sp.]
MKINKSLNDGKLKLEIIGRLDTLTAPELDKELKETLTGVKELEIACNDLEYISSAGLRVLLTAQKMMNAQGEMYITGCSDDILDIFEITGFSQILTVK